MVDVTAETHARRVETGWQVQQVTVDAIAAATATRRSPIFVAPFNCELGEVALINSVLATGATGTTKNINIVNGGQEGAGTTELANRDLITGVNLAVGKTLIFDNIQGASAEVFLTQGDIIELEYELVGGGIAIGPVIAYIAFRVANLSS